MCCRDGGTKERKVEKVEGEGLCRRTALTASEKQATLQQKSAHGHKRMANETPEEREWIRDRLAAETREERERLHQMDTNQHERLAA